MIPPDRHLRPKRIASHQCPDLGKSIVYLAQQILNNQRRITHQRARNSHGRLPSPVSCHHKPTEGALLLTSHPTSKDLDGFAT